MKMDKLNTEGIHRLREYDTPTVCNVIELFGVRPRDTGYMNRTIQACFPEFPPMVGYAVTATFKSSASHQGNIYTRLEDQITELTQTPSPAVVVFQDLDDPPVAATFGEIMCTTYKTFGAAGLITGGAGRDLEQVHALGFPIFTSGSICSHGYGIIPETQIDVQVGGLAIRPGDLLHGDRNGVTTIPRDIAPDIADACEEFAKAEKIVLDYLKNADVTIEGYAEAKAEQKRRIEALKDRVARKE